MTPPKGNQNATKHGLRRAMALGQLPKEPHVSRSIAALGGYLRQEVAERNGGIVSAWHLARITTAQKWERVARLAVRYLARDAEKPEAEQMPLAERLRFAERAATASDNRDRAIRDLGLDRDATAGLMPWQFTVQKPAIQAPSTQNASSNQPRAAAPVTSSAPADSLSSTAGAARGELTTEGE